MDSARNVYVSCVTSGGYGYQPQGKTDACIQALDRFGRYKWSGLVGSPGDDRGTSVATDGAGNVYLLGVAKGSVNTLGQPYRGGSDCFVAKYPTSGPRAWVSQFGTAQDDECNAIAVGVDGAIWVAGTTTGALKPGVVNAGYFDAFLVKVSSDGATITAVDQWGQAGADSYSALAVSSGGDLYAAGDTAPSLARSAGRAACSSHGTPGTARCCGAISMSTALRTRRGSSTRISAP